MPTKNPRINVTLKPSTAAILRRMSQLTKNSQSSIIAELIDAAAPVIERTVTVLMAAEEARSSVGARIRESLEDAEAALGKQLGLMLGDIETRTADMVDDLEGIRRRVRRTGAAQRKRPAGPPFLTGGSHRPHGKGRKARRTRAKPLSGKGKRS